MAACVHGLAARVRIVERTLRRLSEEKLQDKLEGGEQGTTTAEVCKLIKEHFGCVPECEAIVTTLWDKIEAIYQGAHREGGGRGGPQARQGAPHGSGVPGADARGEREARVQGGCRRGLRQGGHHGVVQAHQGALEVQQHVETFVEVPVPLEETLHAPKVVQQERIFQQHVETVSEVPAPFIHEVVQVPRVFPQERIFQQHVETVGEFPAPLIQEETVQVPKVVQQERIIQQHVESVCEGLVPLIQEEVVHLPKVVQQERIILQHVETVGEIPVPLIQEEVVLPQIVQQERVLEARRLASLRAGRVSMAKKIAADLVIEARGLAEEQLTKEAEEAKKLAVVLGTGLRTGKQYFDAKVEAEKKVAEAMRSAAVKITEAAKLASVVAEKAALWANDVV
jgi:hypothetical protein